MRKHIMRFYEIPWHTPSLQGLQDFQVDIIYTMSVGVFKNDEVSKIDDPGIVSHGFDLVESKYVG